MIITAENVILCLTLSKEIYQKVFIVQPQNRAEPCPSLVEPPSQNIYFYGLKQLNYAMEVNVVRSDVDLANANRLQ